MDTFDHDEFADLLRSWPYEPGKLSARSVDREELPPVLLVRVELGLLQLESTGRPDGVRPGGHESIHDELLGRDGTGAATLDPAVCEALHREAAQYSYRSLVFSVLEDYEAVLRDTERNLIVMGFVEANAAEIQDKDQARRARIKLLMMRARAFATISVRRGEISSARTSLESGLDEIRTAMSEMGRLAEFEECDEARLLRGMHDMLVPRLPASQRQEMQERLEEAVLVERHLLCVLSAM